MNGELQTLEGPGASQPGLSRSLSLWHATLYGLGVTIGAGIYVLIGAVAARAGMHAPLAFVAAAGMMALSAASFAELACRFPVAASEAAFAREAFGSDRLATVVGLLVVAIAIVSASAISIGSAGYLVFLPLPKWVMVAAVVVSMGTVAVWGVKQSVTFAGVMTLIEIGGLLLLVAAGVTSDVPIIARLPEMVPAATDWALLAGLMGATLLAVFAFIGFEGLANVAEEVRDPKRTLPKAIFLTLAISALLYVCVVWIALVAVGHAELARSDAPLALVFERLTGLSPRSMSFIALIATLNGIIVQIIMSSRVLYGLARQGDLPAGFATVDERTRTPVMATAFTTALVLAFALMLPLHDLAEVTSRLTLVVFAVVNVSLIRIERRPMSRPSGIFEARAWIPWAGAATCILLLVLDAATTLVGVIW